MSKFKAGDMVVYDGLIATIENVDKIYGTDIDLYSLVSVEDEELTCSARADGIEIYNGEEIDQSDRLARAEKESTIIACNVDKVTDKYIGDCSQK